MAQNVSEDHNVQIITCIPQESVLGIKLYRTTHTLCIYCREQLRQHVAREYRAVWYAYKDRMCSIVLLTFVLHVGGVYHN